MQLFQHTHIVLASSSCMVRALERWFALSLASHSRNSIDRVSPAAASERMRVSATRSHGTNQCASTQRQYPTRSSQRIGPHRIGAWTHLRSTAIESHGAPLCFDASVTSASACRVVCECAYHRHELHASHSMSHSSAHRCP